jgi:hypothetical protein
MGESNLTLRREDIVLSAEIAFSFSEQFVINMLNLFWYRLYIVLLRLVKISSVSIGNLA